MRYFCGDISAVHCFGAKAPGRQIWSTAQFSFRFKNGAVGALTGSYDIERGHPMERCEVGGTGGRFVLDDMWRELTLYPAGNLEKTVYSDPLFGGFHNFEIHFPRAHSLFLGRQIHTSKTPEDIDRERIHCFLRQITDGVAPEDIDGSGAEGLAAQKVESTVAQWLVSWQSI